MVVKKEPKNIGKEQARNILLRYWKATVSPQYGGKHREGLAKEWPRKAKDNSVLI
jgi:hypothetical protein